MLVERDTLTGWIPTNSDGQFVAVYPVALEQHTVVQSSLRQRRISWSREHAEQKRIAYRRCSRWI